MKFLKVGTVAGFMAVALIGCSSDDHELGHAAGGTAANGGTAGSASGGGASGGGASGGGASGGGASGGGTGPQTNGGAPSELECESGAVALFEWTSTVDIDNTLRVNVNNTRLVIDSDFAYFDFGGPLRRISLRTREERVISPISDHAFDAQSGVVYFAHGGTLYRAAMDDAPVAVAPSKRYFGSNVSVNATDVYWVDDTRVMRSTLQGAFSAQATELSSDGDIVASAGHLYTMRSMILPGDMGGQTFRVNAQPTAGGSAVHLGSFKGTGWLASLAGDDAVAHLAAGSGIERFAPASGDELPKLTAPGNVTSVALDDDDLYAGVALDECSSASRAESASCQAALQRFPRDGSSSVRVRDLDQLPVAVAVDDRCVYWLQAKRVEGGTSWTYAAKLVAAPKNAP